MRVAVQTRESYLPAEECHEGAILHEEISRLPEGLRSSLVLCYLEGLSYEAAAHRLGVSETTVRGRLARARERLRRRLTARGVTFPAGLLVAGTAGHAQAAVPASLAHSTVRIALGFVAGKSASVLARGVLATMLLNRLKVATVLLLLGFGGPYGAWHALAGLADDGGQVEPGQVAGKTPAPRHRLPHPSPKQSRRWVRIG